MCLGMFHAAELLIVSCVGVVMHGDLSVTVLSLCANIRRRCAAADMTDALKALSAAHAPRGPPRCPATKSYKRARYPCDNPQDKYQGAEGHEGASARRRETAEE
jgi:hypothetical protein